MDTVSAERPPTSPSPVYTSSLYRRSGAALLLLVALFAGLSLSAYFSTGLADQSLVERVLQGGTLQGHAVENWMGLPGALLAYFLVFEGFGISSALLVLFLAIVGTQLLGLRMGVSWKRLMPWFCFSLFWGSMLLGVLAIERTEAPLLSHWSGGVGYVLAVFVYSFLGRGTVFVLGFVPLLLLLRAFGFSYKMLFPRKKEASPDPPNMPRERLLESPKTHPIAPLEDEQASVAATEKQLPAAPKETLPPPSTAHALPSKDLPEPHALSSDEPTSEPTQAPLEENLKDDLAENLEDDLINFEIEYSSPRDDSPSAPSPAPPAPEPSRYQAPPLHLLDEGKAEKQHVDREELEQHKNSIIDTLTNFRIGISSIKATIGPSVTLYEIVPEAGVRISKIKNLEDDIALSLSALGIRIIAPIPGKGTIGIEVPNAHRTRSYLRTMLQSTAFTQSDYALPVVLGKTIADEVYVQDLTRMPHLLMAGATGQGKSVCINTLLLSLLYKKHPSELKFVLVDPKKVELTLFSAIEKHFLAKLPEHEEAIITDTKKVIHTLQSLCAEMDARYELLKTAMCRHITEYNKKLQMGALDRREGHRFLPYIVLIMDELADLMMTAGKEVETPIARLAQLARAIGIHLVVATQRPSVNVITGIIKANFPARISFKVTSHIDSRTILDSRGAEQLIGMGDMLFSTGATTLRLQGPYVDTQEVARVCHFIGEQAAGDDAAYALPEVKTADDKVATSELEARDSLFSEAAHLVVRHQQGSASLIQRKMKLGFNRAGRLIDQLEMAGILGAAEGSNKPREVLVSDEYALEGMLAKLEDPPDA